MTFGCVLLLVFSCFFAVSQAPASAPTESRCWRLRSASAEPSRTRPKGRRGRGEGRAGQIATIRSSRSPRSPQAQPSMPRTLAAVSASRPPREMSLAWDVDDPVDRGLGATGAGSFAAEESCCRCRSFIPQGRALDQRRGAVEGRRASPCTHRGSRARPRSRRGSAAATASLEHVAHQHLVLLESRPSRAAPGPSSVDDDRAAGLGAEPHRLAQVVGG